MQDTLNRIKEIQKGWDTVPDCTGPEMTEEQYQKIKFEQEKQARIGSIKARLTELDKDFMQAVIGYNVPDLAARKQEFNELYTELCALEGKEPRNKENNDVI